MSDYIIIRAGVNGGKTTTSGLVFEELKKSADFFKIFDYNFKELIGLKYNENGSTRDFIAIIIINGLVIVIISQGDISSELKKLLDRLLDKFLIKKLTEGLKDQVDIYVCCARSQMRTNSTIQMLYDRVLPPDTKKEFWTKKGESFQHRNDVKKEIVNEIVDYILSKAKENTITGNMGHASILADE